MAEATSVVVPACGPRGLLPQPRKAGEGHRSVSPSGLQLSSACEMPWESSALPLPGWVTEQKAGEVGTAHLSPSETPKRRLGPSRTTPQREMEAQRQQAGRLSRVRAGAGPQAPEPGLASRTSAPRLQTRAPTHPPQRLTSVRGHLGCAQQTAATALWAPATCRANLITQKRVSPEGNGRGNRQPCLEGGEGTSHPSAATLLPPGGSVLARRPRYSPDYF